MEFNATDNFMDEKELKHFESLCEVLGDKAKYFKTKVSDHHDQLLQKLIRLPSEKVFPCLDLYRIFLLHPDCVMHWKKYEAGANHLYSLLAPLADKQAGDAAAMCALRCISNLFREQTAIYILREKHQKTLETISPHLASAKQNVRQSALTVMLNYSILVLQKEDHSLRMAILSAFSSLKNGLNSEQDETNKKLLIATVNNLTYKNYEAKKLAKELNLLN